MSLKSADHVDAIIRVLSKDEWLADLAWRRDENTQVHEWRSPDGGGPLTQDQAAMIHSSRLILKPTGVLLWADRAAWDADGQNRRYRSPLSRKAFKRTTRTRVDTAVERTFRTPLGGLTVHTVEIDGRIVRMEFHAMRVPHILGVSDVVRTIDGADAVTIAQGLATS